VNLKAVQVDYKNVEVNGVAGQCLADFYF